MSKKTDKHLTSKHVLFLSRLLTPHVGGVERHIDALAAELIPRGYRITVITEQYDASLPLKEKTSRYTVYRIPKELQSKSQVWLWMFKHMFLFLRADIIHAHDVFWWALPLRFILFWKKFFTTFHGYEGVDEPTESAIRSRKVSAMLSRGVICVGAWMEKWYGTKPDKVIYGAADFVPQPPVKNTSAVFIGRLSEDTGVLEYIRAIELLHGKVELDVYGEGELLGEVQSYAKRLPYVHFNTVSTVVSHVLGKHRFAFVSRYLGMIEAMQTGRYVFAHWNNAIKRDYLESFPGIQHASTFSLPAELAQELQYVLAHPADERKKMIAARSWATNQQWSTIANVYEELWKK